MATDKSFADFVLDQMRGAGTATCKKMFGEYGVYLNSVIVGLICDNQFFAKPTAAGRAYIESSSRLSEAPPYTGAKKYFLIDDKLDDPAWMSGLMKASYAELAVLEKGKKKAKKRK